MTQSSQDHSQHEGGDRAISLSYFFHTLQAYKRAILLALASVALAYAIAAVLWMLVAASQSVTILRFRLEFTGAAAGTYPNGTKFAPSEIISQPVMLKVYKNNHLERFLSYETFTNSIFIGESNFALERLISDYQARLSDPKLTPIDRDRVLREFEAKRDSISKNEYAISFLRQRENETIPENLVRKVLSDSLSTWANHAEREQHVTAYKVSVLAPTIMNETAIERQNPIIALHVLRTKLMRAIQNVNDLSELPAAELVRTPRGNLSVAEVRLSLQDMVRFRLEPLVPAVRAVSNTAAATEFLRAQLEYDERQLTAARERADAVRQALAVYAQPQDEVVKFPDGTAPSSGARQETVRGTETLMPQLSDTFIDRLVALTAQSGDAEYRRKLADDYHETALEIIPLQQAVEYDRQMLELVASRGSASLTAEQAAEQIAAIRNESRQMLATVGELHQILSRNLNPSTQLFSPLNVPFTYTQRAAKPMRLALFGILTMLVALPLIVIACLIHNRINEEDAAALEDARVNA